MTGEDFLGQAHQAIREPRLIALAIKSVAATSAEFRSAELSPVQRLALAALICAHLGVDAMNVLQEAAEPIDEEDMLAGLSIALDMYARLMLASGTASLMRAR